MRAHNGTEPDLVEEENRFTVRLWKEPRTRPMRVRDHRPEYGAET